MAVDNENYNRGIIITIVILASLSFCAIVGIVIWRIVKKFRSKYGKSCKTDKDCKQDGPNMICSNGYCIPTGTVTCTTDNTTENPLILCDMSSPSAGGTSDEVCSICNNTPAYSCGYITWGSPEITEPGNGFTSSGPYSVEFIRRPETQYQIEPLGMTVEITYVNFGKVTSISITQPGSGYLKGDTLRIYNDNLTSPEGFNPSPNADGSTNYCEFILTENPTLYPTGQTNENGTDVYVPPDPNQSYCLPQSQDNYCDLNVSDVVVSINPVNNEPVYTCSCTNPTMFGYNPVSGQCNTVYACQEAQGSGSLQVFYQNPNETNSTPTPCNTNNDCKSISEDSICCAKGSPITMDGGSTVGSIYAPNSISTFGMCIADPTDKTSKLSELSNGVFGTDNTGYVPIPGPISSSPEGNDYITSPNGEVLEPEKFSGFCTVKWSELPEAEQKYFDPNQGICACGTNVENNHAKSVNTVLQDTNTGDTTLNALYCELDTCMPNGTLNTTGGILASTQEEAGFTITTGTCSCKPGYVPCGCDEVLNITCNKGIQSAASDGDIGDITLTNCGINGQPMCAPDPCLPYGYYVQDEPVGNNVQNSSQGFSGACVCFDGISSPSGEIDVTSPASDEGGQDQYGNFVPACVRSPDGTQWIPPGDEVRCYSPYCAVDYGGMQISSSGTEVDIQASTFAGSSTYLLCQGKTNACQSSNIETNVGEPTGLPTTRGTCISKKQTNVAPGQNYYYYEACVDCACPYCNYVDPMNPDLFDKELGINPNCKSLSVLTENDDIHAVANNTCSNIAGSACTGDYCTGDGLNQPAFGANCWDPTESCVYQPGDDPTNSNSTPQSMSICQKIVKPTLPPSPPNTSEEQVTYNDIDKLNKESDIKKNNMCDKLVENMPKTKNDAWKCVKNLNGTWDIPNATCFPNFCNELHLQTADAKDGANTCTGFKHQAVCNSVIRKLQINEVCCGGGAYVQYSQCDDYSGLIDTDSKFCKNKPKLIKSVCNICS
jgi:hypothetical protein